MVGQFEQIASALIVFLIMLGMGATLTPRNFIDAFKQPSGMLIGLACQYGIMPLLGFVLISVLPLPEAISVGLLVMACMPGGTTSNMFTYFARGNVALSVLMTVNSTIFGVVLIPILISIYAAALNLTIPRENIILTLIILLVPVILGMIIRHLSVSVAQKVEKFSAGLGIIFIAFLILSWVPRNLTFLMNTTPATFFAAIALGVFGILFGYAMALLLRVNTRDARTIAIETGLQNGPLAFGIIALSFTGPEQQSYMAVPALYSTFIVIVATLFTLYFRRSAPAAA